MKNALKILKEGGKFEMQVPHFKNPSAYRFTHQHYFSYSMFCVYPEPHDLVQEMKPEKIELIVDKKLPFSLLNGIANLFHSVWERLFYVSGLRVVFVKKK